MEWQIAGYALLAVGTVIAVVVMTVVAILWVRGHRQQRRTILVDTGDAPDRSN